MDRKKLAILFYILGGLIFSSIFIIGYQIQEPIKFQGLHQFIRQSGPAGGVSWG